ncbi:MAG: SipW-dependent-type signal peptide-containing protein [Oscillospiraceae bacterium]|jgi:predicted ribosomally synthesized peptide with SipW-like signal peptide|nr:SipW-dependent-type signal peptide-containing protein [Oscillospiraceae bacterium]
MKKKLVLGIIAAALALSLAIGGTLMLFTASTDTATNVVTLGNVKIELQEWGGYDEDGDVLVTDWTKIEDGEFEGIEWVAEPGGTINKHTQVENTGANAAYVAVRVDVEYDIEEKADIATLGYLLGLNNAGLTGGTFVPDGDYTAGEFSGWWVYTADTASNDLSVKDTPAALAKDGVFSLVNPLTIPSSWISENAELSIEFTAYAVQTQNLEATAIASLAAFITFIESTFDIGA